MVNWILVELKNDIFLIFGYWVFQNKNVLFFPNENQLGFHMRYHLFLHYEWFLQNLGKEFIRTNMPQGSPKETPIVQYSTQRIRPWGLFL